MDIAYGKAPCHNGYGTFKCVQTKAIERRNKYREFAVIKAEQATLNSLCVQGKLSPLRFINIQYQSLCLQINVLYWP